MFSDSKSDALPIIFFQDVAIIFSLCVTIPVKVFHGNRFQ